MNCKCCNREKDLRLGVCFDCANAESIVVEGVDMWDNEIPKQEGLSTGLSKVQHILRLYGFKSEDFIKICEENQMLKRVLKSTDDNLTCISWDDEPPIRLKLDAEIKKVQAENEKLKKALGRIYTMDTSFENYINAIVELKQIAGDAIK
jgi:hypothetical protein